MGIIVTVVTSRRDGCRIDYLLVSMSENQLGSALILTYCDTIFDVAWGILKREYLYYHQNFA